MKSQGIRSRVLMLLLAMMLVVSACSSGTEGKEKGNSSTSDALALSEKGTFPLVTEKATLKVMIPSNSLVENFETNEFTKWYEEKTNVHIEWIIVPQQSASEKLNLMLASGDYPDIIMGMGVSAAQQMIYGKQGVFLPLNDYIDEYSVNFKKVLEERDYLKASISAPDGNIYALPEVNECYHCSMAQKLWINQDWLDALRSSPELP